MKLSSNLFITDLLFVISFQKLLDYLAMTNLNANGAQSEIKSNSSNAQNEVFDSEQIHSEQLELPDGSEYLDESKAKLKRIY